MNSTKKVNNFDHQNIIQTPSLDYEPKESIGAVYFNHLRKHGNKIAQYIAETGETETFSDLLQRSIRVALKLTDQGLVKGDIISICSPNDNPSNAAVYLAATFSGAIIAPSIIQSADIIKKVTPKFVFVAPDSVRFVESRVESAGVSSKIVVFGQHDRHQSFDEYLEPHRDEIDFKPVSIPVKETVIILFSSGTTGEPKGICHSSYSLLSSIHSYLSVKSPTRIDGCVLTPSPLYWSSGAIGFGFAIIAGLPRLIICSAFDPVKAWNYIQGFRVFQVSLTPLKATEMQKTGKPNGDFSNLRSVTIGGANISESVLSKLRKSLPGTLIARIYGSTETGGLTSFDAFQEKKPGSCGGPLRGVSYKIVDSKGGIVGPNQPGELRVKSQFMMNGFYDTDSCNAFDSDGWFKTGDLVYYDRDFCFYVVDRLKEMLTYRGNDVSPSYLEGLIASYPGVKEAVVVGKPHEIDGEWPMAVVQMEEKRGIFTDLGREIEGFVNSRVSEFQKLRAGVKFINDFPRNVASDKVNRQLVRDMAFTGELI